MQGLDDQKGKIEERKKTAENLSFFGKNYDLLIPRPS
jgi:hypothetical protein